MTTSSSYGHMLTSGMASSTRCERGGECTPSAASEPVPNPLLGGHVDERDGLLNKVRAGTPR